MQEDLFEEEHSVGAPPDAPLAARMRPRTLDEVVGQDHLSGPDTAFRRAVDAGKLGSCIFWGPPGVGKTTLAEAIATSVKADFQRVSAVSAGVADLRKVVEIAKRKRSSGVRTVLFVDEIHRFNKGQQDAILPYVEDGTITLIGATTENPSFEVNSALLSRSRVYTLNSIADEDIRVIIRRALSDKERGLGAEKLQLDDDAEIALAGLANGDARSALNMLELCAATAKGGVIDIANVKDAALRKTTLYDKSGEMHFDMISALHKSVRNSDPDAALYWLARMLAGGGDPLYLARRLMRMSVEDIGLAEPQALTQAVAAQQAVHFMGQPEGELALAQCAVFMACAPKSARTYKGYKAAQKDVEETRNDPVPLAIRNAPTRLMKDLGYGEGYKYAPDDPRGITELQCLPDSLVGRTYYEPGDSGYEARIKERLKAWRESLGHSSG